jgi:hypothetical protein
VSSFQPYRLDQDWILQENFMITFPRCVDFFPFRRVNLYSLPRVTVFISELEICTSKTQVRTLTNGTSLTEFGGLQLQI